MSDSWQSFFTKKGAKSKGKEYITESMEKAAATETSPLVKAGGDAKDGERVNNRTYLIVAASFLVITLGVGVGI